MVTNLSKNSASAKPYIKAGNSLKYDNHLTYDAVIDPISGNPVYYDNVGTAVTATNLGLNSASATNQSKS